MIQIHNMRVDYDGFTAVHGLTMEIGSGQVFGLIGPNGAGKTSTIRVLATLLEPTYGEVHIGGFDVAEQPDQVHRILGFMPDLAPVYDDLKVWEFLDLFAAAYYLDRRVRRKRIDECLEMVGLTAKRDVKGGALSRGMTQRCVLAKTLLHDPEILLLDEPASGVDPIGRIEFRKIMRELAQRGHTVLVSSHILTELADMCDAIGVMEQGRLIESGQITDIVTRMQPNRRVEIDCPKATQTAQQVLAQRPGVLKAEVRDSTVILEFTGDDEDLAGLITHLVASGVAVTRFVESRMNVEDIMLSLDAREVS